MRSVVVSVIIVNYRVYPQLANCLQVMFANEANVELDIIVVDNASITTELLLLQNKLPAVQWLINDENIGFSKANNQAIARAKGEFILFLNPDTEVSQQVIYNMVQYGVQHPNAGALGVYMQNGAGQFLAESKRAFPTPRAAFFKLIGLSKLFPNSGVFNAYALGNLDKHTNHQVQVLAGACMLIPKRVLDEVGSFDERFFMYAEDIDLCYRIELAGYSIHYLGTEKIVHFKGASTDRNSKIFRANFYGSMKLFVEKYSPAVYGRTVSRILVFGIGLARSLAALRNFLLRSGN